MAHYGIALGGNKRNFPGWDNLYASGNTAGDIKYSGHMMVRHKAPVFDFDGTSSQWQSYFKMETPNQKYLVGDFVDVHWINQGTHINRIVVQNKTAASAGTAIKVRVRDSAGAVVGPVMTVDLTVVGYTGLGGANIDVAMPLNGAVEIELTGGDLTTACFAIGVDLVTFASATQCGCIAVPCDSPAPAAQCFTAVPQP